MWMSNISTPRTKILIVCSKYRINLVQLLAVNTVDNIVNYADAALSAFCWYISILKMHPIAQMQRFQIHQINVEISYQ